MIDVHSLIWESNGIRLEFSGEASAKIFADLDNIASNTSGVFDRRSAPGVDGTRTYSAALSGAQLTIDATVLAYNLGSRSRPVDRVLSEYRRTLCDAFNPRVAGKLTKITETGSFFLNARAASTPGFGVISGGALPFTVDLYADDPYWRRTERAEIQLGASSTYQSFPSEISGELGEVLSIRTYIPNQSKNEIYPVVRFWPCGNKQILRNETTGKKLELNTRITDGFYVDVDTDPAENTVTLWRKTAQGYEETDNVTYWLTLDSTPDFYLQPGENLLQVDNAVAGVYPSVTLMWYERELGV